MEDKKEDYFMKEDLHIVRFLGGLGNQLFEYALYKTFLEMGYTTKADISDYQKGIDKRDFHLNDLGIKIIEADNDEISKLYAGSDSVLKRAIIKRIGKNTYYRQRGLYYDDMILQTSKGYFDGYWQSYKYFQEYADVIKESIHLPKMNQMGDDGRKILEQIKAVSDSVSLHVRLGDYKDNAQIYGNICTRDYYDKAINYIENVILEKGRKTTFFVFSDDIDEAHEYFDRDDLIYVSPVKDNDCIIDMALMSSCRHHIIANSSFSWWGAYLGQHKDTVTVAPSKWANNLRNEDIIPPEWIRA